jgi:hypothetical protein
LSLIDPSRITPRDLLIIGLVLVLAFWAWHEFVLIPGRLVDQLCERTSVLEADKASEEKTIALDEMNQICRERRPAIEGP